MNPLISSPLYTLESLGSALPIDPNAVSCCLPTWKSVIQYEENNPAILEKLQAGYPRFFLPKSVQALTQIAQNQLFPAKQGAPEPDVCLLFPDISSAREGKHFVERKAGVVAQIVPFYELKALAVPSRAFSCLKFFWRLSGEGISNRLAENYLRAIDGINPFPQPFERSLEGHLELRQKLANLQLSPVSAENIFLYPSGMAAIFAAFRSVTHLQAHRKTLQLGFPYVDTLKIQQNFGAGVDFPNILNPSEFENALEKIREGVYSAVFCEIPSNPRLSCINLPEISQACKESNTILVVDDSIASCFNVDLTSYADLIATSLTKWISGKGNLLAGQILVSPNSPWAAEILKSLRERDGASRLYDNDAAVLLENLGDFAQRMERINASTQEILPIFLNHPDVAEVLHPSLPSSEFGTIPFSELSPKGYGGLFSVIFHDPKKAAAFYDKLEMCKGPSFGTDFSLVCPFTLLAHYDELAEVAKFNVPSHLLRFSIGLEEPEVLIRRISTALG